MYEITQEQANLNNLLEESMGELTPELEAALTLNLDNFNAKAEGYVKAIKNYKAEQRARALKAQAEAEMFKMEQESIGRKKLADAEAYAIEQKGIAEASAIERKGIAEAEAMRKKADAFKEYGDAAKAQMVIEKLPEIAKSVAQPIGSIKDVRIYGGSGNGIAEISGQVPTVIKQTMDTVADATGVDMTEIVKQSTLENAVKRTAKSDEK